MSVRTERAYVGWIEGFLRYHRDLSGTWKHPQEMGDQEVNDYLTMLAVDRKVSASTQNQALSAILFLYTKVLDIKLEFNAVRAKRPDRLPVVLSIDEVRRVLCAIPEGSTRIMAGLMCGAGLRLMESQYHDDLHACQYRGCDGSPKPARSTVVENSDTPIQHLTSISHKLGT